MSNEQFYNDIQKKLNSVKYEIDRISSMAVRKERVIEEIRKTDSTIELIENSIKNHNLEQLSNTDMNKIMSYFGKIFNNLKYAEIHLPDLYQFIKYINDLLTSILEILTKMLRNTSHENNSDFEKNADKIEETKRIPNQLKNDIISLDEKIESMNNEISNNFKECQDKYGEISQNMQATREAFVRLSQTSGILEGRVNEIDTKLKHKWSELEDFKNELNALMNQGKEMLGITTIASLAKSYKEARKSYDEEVEKWQNFFFYSIAIMLLLTFITIFDINFKNGFSYHLNVNTNDYLSILNSFLIRLPFYIPLVWLAIFASNRRNEAKRLRGEYEHKETLANVYYGYKEQIKDLKDEKAQELAAKLMQNLVEMTNENPNRALDKVKTENIPTIEVIEKFLKLSKDFQKLFEKNK